jgi:hypothetical protein
MASRYFKQQKALAQTIKKLICFKPSSSKLNQWVRLHSRNILQRRKKAFHQRIHRHSYQTTALNLRRSIAMTPSSRTTLPLDAKQKRIMVYFWKSHTYKRVASYNSLSLSGIAERGLKNVRANCALQPRHATRIWSPRKRYNLYAFPASSQLQVLSSSNRPSQWKWLNQ